MKQIANTTKKDMTVVCVRFGSLLSNPGFGPKLYFTYMNILVSVRERLRECV